MWCACMCVLVCMCSASVACERLWHARMCVFACVCVFVCVCVCVRVFCFSLFPKTAPLGQPKNDVSIQTCFCNRGTVACVQRLRDSL